LAALRKRASKPQSPAANKNGLSIIVIKEVALTRDETITVKLNDFLIRFIPAEAD
jgi:hypothetical protein